MFRSMALIALLFSVSTLAAPAPLIQSEGTSFVGLNGPHDTEAYFGIPYAQAPVGNLRWKAPRKIRLGQTVRAQRMGPVCAQQWNMFSNVSPDYAGQAVGSEDCLYLNVWKPKQNTSYKRPVFFWIHGGSNTKGTANDPNYDGAWFAQHNDAIYVSVNYRLGLFASFIHSSMETGNKLDNAGNHVTLDLIMALNWVKANIENFGGDPDNIVIAGQSAGCMNVWGLLQSPMAKNLFNGAICSAGLPNAYPKLVIEERSDALLYDLVVADKLAKDVDEAKSWVRKQGPQTIRKYLLSKSAAQLLGIPRFIVPTQHVSDGTVLPFDGLAAVMTGRYNRVPMILGSTIDEATYLVGASMFKPSEADLFRMLISGRSFPRSAIIKDEYLSTFDGITRSSSIGLSNSLESLAQSLRPFNWNIYKYEFTWKETPEPWKGVFGAFHGLDAIFYLGNFVEDQPQFAKFAWRPSNKKSREDLREHMSHYFKSFLHHGNPNEGHNSKEWRSFSATGSTYKF